MKPVDISIPTSPGTPHERPADTPREHGAGAQQSSDPISQLQPTRAMDADNPADLSPTVPPRLGRPHRVDVCGFCREFPHSHLPIALHIQVSKGDRGCPQAPLPGACAGLPRTLVVLKCSLLLPIMASKPIKPMEPAQTLGVTSWDNKVEMCGF